MSSTISRPTRSQQQLLEFIAAFIKEYGYGPSYREIMRALDYKSVSTVAAHVSGLIAKGALKKHGRSARSLEVLSQLPKQSNRPHEAWLEQRLHEFAVSERATKTALRQLAQSFGHLKLVNIQQMAEEYARQQES